MNDTQVEDHLVNEKPFSVKILWGRAPEDYEGKPKEYRFRTASELTAFLKGVEEAAGWLEYTVVED